jgi:hypothetical protein
MYLDPRLMVRRRSRRTPEACIEARAIDPDGPADAGGLDFSGSHELPYRGPGESRELFGLLVSDPLAGHIGLHLHFPSCWRLFLLAHIVAKL